MILAGFTFSLMTLAVKFLSHIPAFELVFFRSLISLVLSIILLKFYNIPMFGNNKKWLFLRGFFGMIALTLFFITLQNLPLASAVSISYLSPIFTIIFGIFILGERVKSLQWIFFIVSFLGAVLIKGFDTNIAWFYILLGVASAIFSGLAYNCVRKVKDTDDALVVVFYFPLVAMPITGVYSAFNWVMPSGVDWLFILALGLFTQIAQVLMTKSLQGEKLAKISVLKYLGVIYALIYSLLIFNESYSIVNLLGMLLVLLGVLLNLGFQNKKVLSFFKTNS
ncbi:MAG: DMT family transporter [Bacteroidia bacterium]|nr:DMT family transporter [Bacteroidia bacterium]